MTADHLLEDDGDFPADASTFAIALAVVAGAALVVFGRVVPYAGHDERRAAAAGLACSVLALVSFPLTAWLGLPFVLGAGGVALGIRARHGERRRRALAAIVLGGLVVAAAAAAFGAVAVDKLS
jgi:hypothetical protein